MKNVFEFYELVEQAIIISFTRKDRLIERATCAETIFNPKFYIKIMIFQLLNTQTRST